ncbi:hypothetical protein [Lolliginicoccus suaedae]|uniref:hypothetical protein n=1 Tax=Lolliginicoccus suaedae TaxID=2605429 RepID=UPI0011EDDF29|nr:hypothetical protein [Lolliginicoccus suaedae]
MGRPYRMFVLGLCSAAALAMVVAFLFAVRLDAAIGNTRSGVNASQPAANADIEGAIAAVAGIADRENALVVASDYDLVDNSRMNLYVLDAGRGGDVLATGYREFTGGEELETLPLAPRMRAEIAGAYYVLGPEGINAALVQALSDHGVPARAWQANGIGESLRTPAHMTLIALAVLTTIVLISAGVVLSSKRYAISRLNGASVGGLYLRDLVMTARHGAVPLAATLGMGFAALYAYNQFAEIGSFWHWLSRGLLVLLVVWLLVHWIAVLGVCSAPLVEGIKGRVRQVLLVPAVYAVRVAAVVVGVSIITGAVAGYQHYEEFTREDAAWQPYSEDSVIRPGQLGADIHDDLDQMYVDLGEALHEMEASGQVRYASRNFDSTLASAGVDNLFRLNSAAARTYLEGADLIGDLPAVGTANTTIVVPPRFAGERHLQAIIEAAAADYGAPEGAPPPRTVLADDYEMFYPDILGGRVLFDEPIVVIRADAAPTDTFSNLGAAASNGSILLTPQAVAELRDDPRSYGVLQFNRAYDAWQAMQASWVSEVRKFQFNAVVAVALLLILAVVSVIVYELRNAQRLRVQFVSGWSPLLSRGWLWTGEALLFALPYALLYRSWSQNQEILADPVLASSPVLAHYLTPVTPLTITLVTLLALIAPLTAALAVRQREHRLGTSEIQK